MTDQHPVQISLFQHISAQLGDRVQHIRCTKSVLVHLSHTLEDMVLTEQMPALLFTGFQESSHWREETARYRALAETAQQVCIFAGGSLPPESLASEVHITLVGDDPLRQEWFVLLLSERCSALLCGLDRLEPTANEATRAFDTIWSFDPTILTLVADLLEDVIAHYRPERLDALRAARATFPITTPDPALITRFTTELVRFEEELHQRLMRTSQQLQEQLRWREDMLATLVHDMRTPLQGVLSVIDLVETEEGDREAVEELLGVGRSNVSNLVNLVQLILDTNQLEAGKLPLRWTPLPAVSWIDQTLHPLLPLLATKKQNLELAISPDVILWGDDVLLQRVVQNLLTNAIKFTPLHGRVHLSVQFATGVNAVELRLRDNGVGIASDVLPHIFNRYYQARAYDKRGNGLGLYFARLVAEAHGGSIRADSIIGTGTTITITLPSRPRLIRQAS